ncbi:MAG TPA: DUF4436 family protein [Acetobacteraceae bacterium]|nr:DUF4436 family protein [Acetobacteraceae bacterium]
MISRLQGPWRGLARPRVLGLASALVLMMLGYAGFVLTVGDDLSGAEQHFGAPPPAATPSPQLGVYVEIVSIDPVNEALHLRLHIAAGAALGRNLTLRLEDGYAVQTLAVRGEEPTRTATVEMNLDGGRAALYPLDRFGATLRFSVQEGGVPIRVTVWEGIAGWTVRAAESPPDAPGAIRVRLELRRKNALVFLALALYGMMMLIAAAALTIGALVFLRVRKVEAALAGCLSGMLFALPAMRYALPGSPALGVLADRLVFLWAELAVGLGLLLFVLAWARQGPPPE